MNPSRSELIELATSVALRAGSLVAERRRAGVPSTASKSSPEDVVTQADRDAETLIRGMLADARPGDGFLGEESEPGEGSSGLTWVVDPIDGTVNYLYGAPQYAVSIAVVEGPPDPARWKALAGVVLNPASGEMFSATAGGGAFLGTGRLQVAETTLALSLVGTGFSYSAERRRAQAEVVLGIIDRVRDIRRGGAASLDLCGVACRRLDAYYERGLQPWDHAAGALIAAEAGARVTGFRGAAATTDFLLAAPPELAATLEGILEPLHRWRI